MTIAQALAQANTKIQAAIDQALTNEVFQAVVDAESAAIDDVVYGVYSPKQYMRRGMYGGMADPDNIEIVGGSAHGGVLEVINTTEPNPGGCVTSSRVTTGKNLPKLIEGGDGASGNYDFYSRNGAYLRPRPFTARTIESLQGSKEHVKALENGLKRQGLKIKK